jgi:hypothetical protein
VLWAPFYLGAHGLSLAGQALGLAIRVDGYAPQYVWAVSLGSAAYGFVAIVLTYMLCREYFPSRLSLLATTAVWLSGTLVFYMYGHPVMSHANDAFAFALLAYTWHRTRDTAGPAGPLLRGAVAGMCALIRLSNAGFVALIVAEYAIEGLRRWRSGDGCPALVNAIAQIALVSLAWWLVFSPQVVTWRIVMGEWIVTNPYAGGAGVGFEWLRPRIIQVLFSTNRGLFVWTPLTLFALIGFFALWRRARRLAAFLLACFLIQLYIIAAWGAWSGSAAFGQRFFTNMTPAFAIGLAALLSALRARVSWQWLSAVCCLFVLWNGLLVARYAIDDIPHSGRVPLSELVIGQFTVVPRHLHRIIEAVITRQ